MSEWSTILPIITILLLIVGIVTLLILLKKRKEGKMEEPDYRAFFIMGISFLPLGIILSVVVSVGLLAIAALGLIYIIIGLTNRDKWK